MTNKQNTSTASQDNVQKSFFVVVFLLHTSDIISHLKIVFDKELRGGEILSSNRQLPAEFHPARGKSCTMYSFPLINHFTSLYASSPPLLVLQMSFMLARNTASFRGSVLSPCRVLCLLAWKIVSTREASYLTYSPPFH